MIKKMTDQIKPQQFKTEEDDGYEKVLEIEGIPITSNQAK